MNAVVGAFLTLRPDYLHVIVDESLSNMFAVIYQFKTKPGCDEDFISGWTSLTKLIYENRGSLGSRLHKASDGSYVAYAKWPLKHLWEDDSVQMPQAAHEASVQMREACDSIETIWELEEIVDLTREKPF